MIEKAVGASIRGKSNRIKRRLNQDSYLIDNNDKYTLAVVADGLGSKKQSRFASKLICKVLKTEVKKAFYKNELDPITLVETIKSRWLQALFPLKTANADTTCLFCIVSSTSILLCQLGDGIIVYYENDEFRLIETKTKDFSNETISLSRAKISDWDIQSLSKSEESKYSIFISTDGVSDDIIENKLEDFTLEVISLVVNKKYRQNPNLKKVLKKWPNKFSLDDKTIVVVK